jgi:hypothetical protein
MLGSLDRKSISSLAQRGMAVAVLLVGTIVSMSAAQAQTSACDHLKDTLAERMDASGVHGYNLEAVPSGAPLPRGARAIGKCESGKYTILYRRGGAKEQPPESTAAAEPDSAATSVAAPERKPRKVVNTPAPEAPRQAVASEPGLAPRTIKQVDQVASAVSPAVAAPAEPLSASSGNVHAENGIEPVAATHPPVVPTTESKGSESSGSEAKVAPSDPSLDNAVQNRSWMWALLLVPAAACLWFWHAHRSAYDKAGLPRGPKL